MKRNRHIYQWRAVLLLLGLAGLWQGGHAQQRMRYTQYLLNTFLTNPAVTGVEPYLDLRAGFSQQWVGIKGAPRSIYFTGQKGLYTREMQQDRLFIHSLPAHGRGNAMPTTSSQSGQGDKVLGDGPNFHMGVGAQIFSESSGPISYNGITGSFAAHLRLVGNLRMAIGASMEMLNYRLNPDAIEMLNANDITLATNRVSLLLPSLNGGIAFYTPKFFIAAASRQLLQNRIQVNPGNPVVAGLEIHHFLQAGVKLRISDQILLTPSAALRVVSPAPPSIDLSAQGAYKDQFFLGLTYRHKDALAFMAGFRFNQNFRLDYAYDYTTSNLSKFNSGSHSIVLSICPGYGKSGGRRYFW
ncbi:MAG: type IX secretion system membrane protein PorP/SprF [Bacteroidia bacterium]